MIHLITSGVQGLKAAEQHVLGVKNVALYFPDLQRFTTPEQLYTPTVPGAIVINMTYPYDREDLKTRTLFESEVFAQIHDALYAYLHLNDGPRKTIYLFAHEHGLGFVPMIATHREQIKRETELLAKIMPLVHSYKIMFAGNVPLTVFER